MKTLILLLALTCPAAAAPLITSISADHGPLGGGNVLTIRGSGFLFCEACSPPRPPAVRFGGIVSPRVTFIDATTLTAVAPVHLPRRVDITVEQVDGSATLRDAYTFAGEIADTFEQLLLPVFVPPVNGAFGSRFITTLRMANASPRRVDVHGLLFPCENISGCIVFDPLEHPYRLEPDQPTSRFELGGTPGRFVYIEKDVAAKVFANLRVFDNTRSAQNFGTEMPIARAGDFRDGIKLLGVALDPRFRNTLRIYSTAPIFVDIAFGDELHRVQLQHSGASDHFDPYYYEFTRFPPGNGTVDVTVSGVVLPGAPPPPGVPFWAFATVTNNDTQLITTITPR